MIPRSSRKKSKPNAVGAMMSKPADNLVTKRQVRDMIRSALDDVLEDKYWDAVASSPADIDSAGTITGCLTDIPQGSSDTNRDGDTLTVKRLTWKVWFRYNATNSTTNLSGSLNVVRFIIFAWKPFSTDVAPTVAKIMTYTATAYAAQAPLTHDGRDQFILLHDECFVTDGFANASKLCQGSLRMNHVIQYKAGSTTNGSGSLYAIYMSNVAAGFGTYPAVIAASYRSDFNDA